MKKGQMHVSETIAVLFIFFVLILFGLVFYFRYQQGALQEKREEMLDQRAMEVSTKTIFLPELMCSKGEAEAEENCLDMARVEHAQELFQKYGDYYFDAFSYAKITLHQVYPLPTQTWDLYDRPKLTVSGNKNQYEPTFFVVTLKNDLVSQGNPIYAFGYLEIGVYS